MTPVTAMRIGTQENKSSAPAPPARLASTQQTTQRSPSKSRKRRKTIPPSSIPTKHITKPQNPHHSPLTQSAEQSVAATPTIDSEMCFITTNLYWLCMHTVVDTDACLAQKAGSSCTAVHKTENHLTCCPPCKPLWGL